MQRLFAALVSMSLAPCALLAQVIQVSGGGDALRLAVAQAPDGAVLVVAPGSYWPFLAVQRHLTIVAPQRAQIAYASGIGGASYVTLVGLGTSQPVRLIGFDVLQGTISSPPGFLYGRIDCGDAYVEDCTCQGIRGLNGFVVVDRTVASSPDGAGISIDHGILAAMDSTFAGGCSSSPTGPPLAGPGIWIVAGALRAERVQAYGGGCSGSGAPAVQLADQAGVSCVATIADSLLVPGPSSPLGLSIACTPGTTLRLSGNQLPGAVTCNPAGGALARLRWLQRQWTPGGASSLRCHGAPSVLAIALASFSVAPNPSPLTTKLKFVGATPDWFVWTAGVTNATGDFDFTIALPNVPAALYASVWLHGLTGTGFPFRATTPLGGIVQ